MKTAGQSLLIMNTSTAVLTVTALALAAAMAERRRAEAAIEQQKATVEAANRTKDTFLAMLSHELRTPLTPVLAAVDALEAEPANSEEAPASLAMIRRNVELESQLIDDLLDLTRIAKDKLQLHFVEMDAHEAIANVAEICTTEARARNIQVHLNLRAGAHFITGDAAKFQQIIWNLLKNAIKFTGNQGEITVATTNSSPQNLTITIRDNGIGMIFAATFRRARPWAGHLQIFGPGPWRLAHRAKRRARLRVQFHSDLEYDLSADLPHDRPGANQPDRTRSAHPVSRRSPGYLPGAGAIARAAGVPRRRHS